MLVFNKTYLLLAILVFAIEVSIAVFVHDGFVRPYVGDVLVVVLLYCLLKSFVSIPVFRACIIVLFVAFAIEAAQAVNLVHRLGLGHLAIARTVLGTSFSWADLVCYTIGLAGVYAAELFLRRGNLKDLR